MPNYKPEMIDARKTPCWPKRATRRLRPGRRRYFWNPIVKAVDLLGRIPRVTARNNAVTRRAPGLNFLLSVRLAWSDRMGRNGKLDMVGCAGWMTATARAEIGARCQWSALFMHTAPRSARTSTCCVQPIRSCSSGSVSGTVSNARSNSSRSKSLARDSMNSRLASSSLRRADTKSPTEV